MRGRQSRRFGETCFGFLFLSVVALACGTSGSSSVQPPDTKTDLPSGETDARTDLSAMPDRQVPGDASSADQSPICLKDEDCDDGNYCTLDGCPNGRCQHTIVQGAACDDADPCTMDDACDAAGACLAGPVRDCEDGNPCTRDSCDPERGCQSMAVADGTDCHARFAGTCVAGVCQCTLDCAGRNCGPDGCGGACGVCPPEQGCNDEGACVETTCQPDCRDLQCGLDPLCGFSCGLCDDGFSCQAGVCLCVPACVGRVCGPDGCNGICGSCLDDADCNAAGQCVPTVCVPDCSARQCGPDPVCGQDCGACAAGQQCVTGLCSCVPNCLGRYCGSNGCDGICGICGPGQRCGESGLCEDIPCEPDCSQLQCGSDPVCGLDCGNCPTPQTCESGTCVCEPYCWGRQCGPDPLCGQSCGECAEGLTCGNGVCQCAADCSGLECGPDPLCSQSCGSCPLGHPCVDGQCQCAPECTDRICGDDGCGGSCGTCPADRICSSAGQCVDAIGCSDGQRDGFNDLAHWPTVAACAGTFGYNSLRAARTGTACGDDLGVACPVPEDLCATNGWHICMRNGHADDLRYRLTPQECRSLMQPFVAATNNCSNQATQNPATVGCNMSEPFDCYPTGWCSAPPVCGPSETSHCAHAIWPNQTRIFGLHAGRTQNAGCGHIATSVAYGGQGTLAGVLCCKDE